MKTTHVLFTLIVAAGSAACASKSSSEPVAEPAAKLAPRAVAAAGPKQARQRLHPLLDQTIYEIPVNAEDPQAGPADALVTIVMFGDFQCASSKRAADTMDELRKRHGDDLRIVWKDNPMFMHADARPAAFLAGEAFAEGGNVKFWQTHDLLFAHQEALALGELRTYAKQLSLDPKKVRSALHGDLHAARVDADIAEAARLDSVVTTPMFAVNGRYLRGAQSLDAFEFLIKEELGKARQRVESGISRSQLYAEIIKGGVRAARSGAVESTN